MILFKVTSIQKRSTLLPTRNEILKLYNKYKKGYDYTKEAWDMKDKVLYAAKTLIERSKYFYETYDKLMEEGYHKADEFSEHWRENLKNSDYITHNWYLLEFSIPKLEQAKEPFDILVAVDYIFNIMHGMGPLLVGLVHGMGYNAEDTLEGESFLETLNTIRDW